MKKLDRVSAPCTQCTKRVLGCNDRCAAYKEYRTKLTAYNEALRLERIADSITADMVFEAGRRLEKRRRH